MRLILWFILLAHFQAYAQQWQAINHINNGKKAVEYHGEQISEFVYSEISELSENKAYVAQGELYAYVDTGCQELSPYIFAEANNFSNGYAIVGDSFNLGLINAKMQIVTPLAFAQVRLPKQGLIVVQTHDGTWGAMDTLGNNRLPFIYNLPPQIIDLEHIIVYKNDNYGVVNDCNDVVFNIAYQYISPMGLGYKSGKYLRLF